MWSTTKLFRCDSDPFKATVTNTGLVISSAKVTAPAAVAVDALSEQAMGFPSARVSQWP
jgi:hypothetical protein